jgi:hypothetical protein
VDRRERRARFWCMQTGSANRRGRITRKAELDRRSIQYRSRAAQQSAAAGGPRPRYHQYRPRRPVCRRNCQAAPAVRPNRRPPIRFAPGGRASPATVGILTASGATAVPRQSSRRPHPRCRRPRTMLTFDAPGGRIGRDPLEITKTLRRRRVATRSVSSRTGHASPSRKYQSTTDLLRN